MPDFIALMLQVIFLLLIAWLCNVIAPKIKLPYTVLLFVVWLLLIPLSQFPWFDFLSSFTLNPDLLFYVFLPILLFESAYNMHSIEVGENKRSTWILATVWLLISTIAISVLGYGWLYLFGFDIPFEVVLLFATIIGTTDPVAVMALFKEYGVPKRLQFIFEWESCFNDGTGLAMFLVVYEIIRSGAFDQGLVMEGVLQFVLMVVWGIALGYLFGYLFSHLINYIKNNEPVEILFTVVMAHFTFIAADLIGHYVHIGSMELKISGVIATVFAGIVMGNYGRSKISPKVEEYMHKFRSFFGFCANSLVFVLIGLMWSTITAPLWQLWLPILILIISVTIARAISVYVPIAILNRFHLEDHIPLSRQHLLAWWSLRWALAFMIALLIADDFTVPGWSFDFSVKEFITAAVIAKIAYTLFFKATTIPLLMKKLHIWAQSERDLFQKYESQILIFDSILKKIEYMKKHYAVSPQILDDLTIKYNNYLWHAKKNMHDFVEKGDQSPFIRQSLWLHALGIEREYVNTMYRYRELTETIYATMIHKFDHQIYRLDKWLPQVVPLKSWEKAHIQQKIDRIIEKGDFFVVEKYMQYRAQNISSYKVIEYFQELKKRDLWYSQKYLDEIIDSYQYFIDLWIQKMTLLYQSHQTIIDRVDRRLYEKWLLKFEESFIDDLLHKNIVSTKLYEEFVLIIDNNIEKVI
jgi:CPA1 family monovalent cation:H+ antiporter